MPSNVVPLLAKAYDSNRINALVALLKAVEAMAPAQIYMLAELGVGIFARGEEWVHRGKP